MYWVRGYKNGITTYNLNTKNVTFNTNSKSQCTTKPKLGLSVKNYIKEFMNVFMGGRGDF